MSDELLPAWTLVRAGHVVGREFTAVFARAGLTPKEFGVLASLDQGDRPTAAELARLVMIRPQSMGELIGGLLDRGLVVRDGPGGRGRRTGIAITDAGRAALVAAWPGVRAFNAPAALGLTAEEAATLDALLERVREAVERYPTSPDRSPAEAGTTANGS